MKLHHVVGSAAAALLLALPLVCSAQEKGWFGFEIKADTQGFSFNPTLRAVSVKQVTAASPAANAGMAVGDAIVEVQGIKVEGAKADTLRSAIHVLVGQQLRLSVKHGDAAPREVQLTAVAKPKT